MFFKRRKFFLELEGGDEKQKQPVVAPVAAEEPATSPEPPAPAAAPAAAAPAPAPAAVPPPDAAAEVSTPAAAEEAAAASTTALTTAEEIAAELAAAEAKRPAPSKATFAPECLTPGGANPLRRRKPGANLGVFKEMVEGMMRS